MTEYEGRRLKAIGTWFAMRSATVDDKVFIIYFYYSDYAYKLLHYFYLIIFLLHVSLQKTFTSESEKLTNSLWRPNSLIEETLLPMWKLVFIN